MRERSYLDVEQADLLCCLDVVPERQRVRVLEQPYAGRSVVETRYDVVAVNSPIQVRVSCFPDPPRIFRADVRISKSG